MHLSQCYFVCNGPFSLHSTAVTNNSKNFGGLHNTILFHIQAKSAVGLGDTLGLSIPHCLNFMALVY